MRNRLLELISTVVVASAAVAACSSSNSAQTAATTGGGTPTAGAANGGQSAGGGSIVTGGSAATTGGSGAAAGGSGAAGGSSSGAVTTLAETKALNALTTAEAAQLCSDTYAYFANAVGGATSCKWKGVYYATQSSAPTQAQLTQNCLNQETPCLSNPGAVWANPNCPDLPTDCTATVAQYSTCIKDEAATFTQSVAAIPDCDTFTNANWQPVWDIVAANPPASCEFCSASGYYPVNPATP
jgi:hypothetical protein